jgi:peptidoglycan hydrolase-like protein with peptidoglycan-binding domain
VGTVTVPSVGNDTGNLDCVLQAGDNNDAVADLQTNLDFCYASFGIGVRPDGNFGPQTVAALEAAQHLGGVPPDGVYAPPTRDVLSWYDFDVGHCFQL